MTFRIEITRVGKFPTSWSLTKLPDFGTYAYLSLCGPTLILRPSNFDRQNSGNFFSFLPSLSGFFFPFSLFVLFFFFVGETSTHFPPCHMSLSHFLDFSFFFSFGFSFWSYPTKFFSFVCSPSFHHFNFSFSSFLSI